MVSPADLDGTFFGTLFGMRVRDLMESSVVTLKLDDNLDLADDPMRLGRIRHMPVVSHGCVAGIVSQRDLFRAEAVMTGDPTTIEADTSLREAVEVMLKKRIGLLSESDCMRHLARLLAIAEEKQALPELSWGT